jgi:hypothetical protein
MNGRLILPQMRAGSFGLAMGFFCGVNFFTVFWAELIFCWILFVSDYV